VGERDQRHEDADHDEHDGPLGAHGRHGTRPSAGGQLLATRCARPRSAHRSRVPASLRAPTSTAARARLGRHPVAR